LLGTIGGKAVELLIAGEVFYSESTKKKLRKVSKRNRNLVGRGFKVLVKEGQKGDDHCHHWGGSRRGKRKGGGSCFGRGCSGGRTFAGRGKGG